MDPEEIARREEGRTEKKKRMQERKLQKSQSKLLAGENVHTPVGSESDSCVSQFTDSEEQSPSINGTIHNGLPATRGAEGHQTESSCDQMRHDCNLLENNHNQRTAEDPEQVSASTHTSSSSGQRISGLQKYNPFSVECLLSDAMPRHKPQLDFPTLPGQRTLVGNGHFLLYPITHQPLGFLVPQTPLKASLCSDNSLNGLGQGQRCAPSGGSLAPSDLSSFVTRPLYTDHMVHHIQHQHNHMGNRADVADVEECGDDCPERKHPATQPANSGAQTAEARLSSMVSGDNGKERSLKGQVEVAATNGCQVAVCQ